MEQTFTQASAWGQGLPQAFSVALDVYMASRHISKIQDAIATILSERKFPARRTDWSGQEVGCLDREMAARINTLIVDSRLSMSFVLAAQCG